jgi:DnaK suppressor protein
MNKTNIRDCRWVLEAKRVELLSSHSKIESIVMERVPDSMDELTLEVQRSMAADALNRRAALLCQVTEALERIAGGKYGVCLVCQNPISSKRLAALPWAALCLECQQTAENGLRSHARTSMSLRTGFAACATAGRQVLEGQKSC